MTLAHIVTIDVLAAPHIVCLVLAPIAVHSPGATEIIHLVVEHGNDILEPPLAGVTTNVGQLRCKPLQRLLSHADDFQLLGEGVFMDDDLELFDCVVADAVHGCDAKVDRDFFGWVVWGGKGASNKDVMTKLGIVEGVRWGKVSGRGGGGGGRDL